MDGTMIRLLEILVSLGIALCVVLLAGLATAGAEDSPEIRDEIGDTKPAAWTRGPSPVIDMFPGGPAKDAVDLTAGWFEMTPNGASFVVRLKVVSLDAVDSNVGSTASFDWFVRVETEWSGEDYVFGSNRSPGDWSFWVYDRVMGRWHDLEGDNGGREAGSVLYWTVPLSLFRDAPSEGAALVNLSAYGDVMYAEAIPGTVGVLTAEDDEMKADPSVRVLWPDAPAKAEPPVRAPQGRTSAPSWAYGLGIVALVGIAVARQRR